MTTALAAAALAAGHRSAGTADLTQRLWWVAGLLVAVLAVYALMWRAWRRRGQRQAGLPELPVLPPEEGPARLTLSGRYHGSTTSGDWLDRIVARGLGTRSLAELTLTGAGVSVRRQGAPGFLIPAESLRGARLDRGIAGKVLTEDGLLVVTWELGGQVIDSGFRADRPAEHDAWVAALNDMTPSGAAGDTAQGAPGAPHDREGPR